MAFYVLEVDELLVRHGVKIDVLYPQAIVLGCMWVRRRGWISADLHSRGERALEDNGVPIIVAECPQRVRAFDEGFRTVMNTLARAIKGQRHALYPRLRRHIEKSREYRSPNLCKAKTSDKMACYI